jgi:hypothetical protein
MRRQPKNLDKLGELDVEPSAICPPHEYSLFLVKEESGVEFSYDLLILVVMEQQHVGDAMELTSFQNSVEVHVLLALHIVCVPTDV